jgi:uncharacterized membrane protein YphA (DoxX/SURF4 family)
MKKIKQILLKTPEIILGTVFLMSGFAKIADLSSFYDTVSAISFLPYFLKGCLLVFVPGLELTLGMILVFKHEMKKSAGVLSFLFFLIAITLSVYAALTASRGCGSCHKLETTAFDYRTWIPAISNLMLLGLSVIAIFIMNHKKDCDDSKSE